MNAATAEKSALLTEVKYHTMFFVVERHEDVTTVFRIIDDMPHGLRLRPPGRMH